MPPLLRAQEYGAGKADLAAFRETFHGFFRAGGRRDNCSQHLRQAFNLLSKSEIFVTGITSCLVADDYNAPLLDFSLWERVGGASSSVR
jgi:hypothetical protein